MSVAGSSVPTMASFAEGWADDLVFLFFLRRKAGLRLPRFAPRSFAAEGRRGQRGELVAGGGKASVPWLLV